MGRKGIFAIAVAAAVGLAIGLIATGAPLQSLFVVGMLLMCPLLMVGMHSGHSDEHGDHASRAE